MSEEPDLDFHNEATEKSKDIETGEDDFKIDKEDKEAIEAMLEYDPWEEIGFMRPLGGAFYSLIFMLFTAILSLVLVSAVFKYLFPYPEIQGYNSIAGGFFAIVYTMFDFGTAFGIKRFIAEYRVKNPEKMLEYVRFYIWYQMFTGIIQVLIISVFVLSYVRYATNVAYLSWIFLIICQKQWPGMLGTFGSILGGLQKYNKARILSFITSDIFQNVTNIIFLLVGRWWGANNPEIGDLFGGVIGYAIGSYIDDFFAMALAGWYFNKEMKPFGITFWDAWRLDIGKDVIKQCLWFGLQTSIVPIVNTATGTAMLLMYYEAIPQYTAYKAIYGIAAGLAGAINVGDFELTPSLAESYMNGKKHLSQFYVKNSLKWNGFFMMLMVTVISTLVPTLLPAILELPGLENYQSAVIFIPFLLIHNMFRPYIDILNPILVGTLHIGFYTFLRLLEEVFQVFFVWLFCFGLKLPELGPIGIAIILGWEHFFPRLIKMILGFIYTQKKIFKIEINWMSTLILPAISASPIILFSLFWKYVVFSPMLDLFGAIATTIITLLIVLFIFVPFVFLPLTGILGCWDDFQLKTFKKAVKLSGPSKWIVKPFYTMIKKGVDLNPKWHNKFKIPWEQAEREMKELQVMKINNTYVKAQKVDPKEFFLKLVEEKRS
ncbi:MAG: hypothetical protein GF364_22145, partial [Candidatus Lokiarchaeota archaeon]|nr:hypothetical protein [Candidatus Lokiarchaeota archaeon]